MIVLLFKKLFSIDYLGLLEPNLGLVINHVPVLFILVWVTRIKSTVCMNCMKCCMNSEVYLTPIFKQSTTSILRENKKKQRFYVFRGYKSVAMVENGLMALSNVYDGVYI